MALTASQSQRNPFMLMLNPSEVLEAMEQSNHLRELNRHLCRPLDKAAPQPNGGENEAGAESDDAALDD